MLVLLFNWWRRSIWIYWTKTYRTCYGWWILILYAKIQFSWRLCKKSINSLPILWMVSPLILSKSSLILTILNFLITWWRLCLRNIWKLMWSLMRNICSLSVCISLRIIRILHLILSCNITSWWLIWTILRKIISSLFTLGR